MQAPARRTSSSSDDRSGNSAIPPQPLGRRTPSTGLRPSEDENKCRARSVSDLDLRTLRYFAILAEELHFRRAAERLHLSQSALSRAIAGLEAQVQTTLLERSSRRVSLTTAGVLLAEHGRVLLCQEQLAFDELDWLAGHSPELRIGFTTTLPTAATALVHGFAERHGAVALGFTKLDARTQVQSLIDGLIDVMFVRLPWSEPNVQTLGMCTEPWVAQVSERSPLATRAAVVLAELGSERICQFSSWRSDLTKTLISHDWVARVGVGPRVATVEEALEYVALGSAIAIIGEAESRYYTRAGVVSISITDTPPIRVGLAWTGAEPNPSVRRFLADATAAGLGAKQLRAL